MFILVQPMYSKQELNADSNYVVYSALIRGMRSVRPDWHFCVLFPDDKSGFKYDDDGFFKSPNVSRIPQRVSPRKHANAITFDAGWYDSLVRQYAFDAVWCNLVEISGHIRSSGTSTYEEKSRPTTIAAHNYVIHESLPYVWESMTTTAFAQVMGAWLSDWNVFNSDHCKRMFVETAGKWLKTSVIEEILAKSSRINYGTLESALAVDEGRLENPVPVIAYNHRLQAYKNWTSTWDLFRELYAEGLRFRVRYMNNVAEHVSQISKDPFVEVKLCANRTQYLEALRGCDLNVTNSQHETFCISAVESMALGQPLIAPDAITFPEITGRKELGYPYLFRSRDEQKTMLRRLLMDVAERRTWGGKLSAFVRREFGQQLWAKRYAELFESLSKYEFNTAADGLDLIRESVKRLSGKTFHDVRMAVQRKEINGRVPFSNQSLTEVKLLRLIRKVGGSVVMEHGKQVVHAAS